MILACHNLEKSFGDQVIVRHGSFHIEDHEKSGADRVKRRREINNLKDDHRGASIRFR